MADDKAKFTDEDKEILQKWLQEKLKNKTIVCELCESTQWGFNEYVFSEMALGKSGLFGEHVIYPHVLFSCQNCGNTKIIGSIKIGITAQQEPVTETKKEGE